jgi:hypothetical protein
MLMVGFTKYLVNEKILSANCYIICMRIYVCYICACKLRLLDSMFGFLYLFKIPSQCVCVGRGWTICLRKMIMK